VLKIRQHALDIVRHPHRVGALFLGHRDHCGRVDAGGGPEADPGVAGGLGGSVDNAGDVIQIHGDVVDHVDGETPEILRVADEGARIERQYLVALLDLACRLAIVGDLDGPGHVERCGASRGKRLGV